MKKGDNGGIIRQANESKTWNDHKLDNHPGQGFGFSKKPYLVPMNFLSGPEYTRLLAVEFGDGRKKKSS